MAGTFIVGETKIRPGVYHRHFQDAPPKEQGPPKPWTTEYVRNVGIQAGGEAEAIPFPYPLAGTEPNAIMQGAVRTASIAAGSSGGDFYINYPLCGENENE
ncbi:MAG: hypothetical protein IJF88_05750 [Oscillospiraceae bacterium]|nr:hypothetical protein [Oscillospiraceae bacterium]